MFEILRTKLMVMQRPIFSFLFMSRFQVMNHGKVANTKSMIMLYTGHNVSREVCGSEMVTCHFRLL
jgi:hypothetical protein